MGEYSKVLNHFKCVHEDSSIMYNGTCSFKMDHKGFPLSTLALVKMMLWSAFHVRTESVLSVGRWVTWSKTAPLSPHGGIMGESGHRAPECPSDSLCSIWESE